jgi:putative endopeptidase
MLSVGCVLNTMGQTKNIGINLKYIDKNADPKKDFFLYANGAWLKDAQIPASETYFGSFNEIRDRNESNLKSLLDEVSTNKTAKPGTNRQKIRDYYNLAMDSAKLEKDRIKPLAADFALIDKIANKADLLKVMANFHSKGINAGFGFFIFPDFKNSNANSAYFSQGGINLPDRDFYFDEKYADLKKAYAQHIENMFLLLGNYPESAKAAAGNVMSMETRFAEVSMNSLEQRDIAKQYNKFTKADFAKKTPNINWDLYFTSIGMKSIPAEVIVTQPAFFEKLNELVNSVPISEWKTYLKWSLIHDASGRLSSDFEKENFSFYNTTLSGQKMMKPKWKRSSQAVDGALGEALGQLYVDKYFSSEAKKRVNTLVDNLLAAYKQRLSSRDWMSAETKKRAQEKLDRIVRKLGFPDKWKDYSNLQIKTDAYVLNHFRAANFEYKRMLDNYGKPVDKTKWNITPPTVNAYYNPSANEVVFPAGIMQPPFFDPTADDAFNYGCMGAIIGHELTHGFDDQGAQFDADGNLKNWWTEEDLKKFGGKTNILVDQFNSYIAVDSVHVNGKLTLGENIADLGGITMSYYAYKMSLGGKPSEVVEGYTGEQRFFLAWAQGWKTIMRPQALKQLVATNPHSPGYFRAIGPLSNMPEFYEAFGVKEGDKMFRPKEIRADIW